MLVVQTERSVDGSILIFIQFYLDQSSQSKFPLALKHTGESFNVSSTVTVII